MLDRLSLHNLLLRAPQFGYVEGLQRVRGSSKSPQRRIQGTGCFIRKRGQATAYHTMRHPFPWRPSTHHRRLHAAKQFVGYRHTGTLLPRISS
jgi:hypothetical protein